MLATNAVFSTKPVTLDTVECVIEKTIHLYGNEFDMFTRRLNADQNFLRDNAEKMYTDEIGKKHCLLVTGEGRRDGILVNSEGNSYARYAALLPDVENFLTLNRYPALVGINKKLAAAADYIAGLVHEAQFDKPNEERFCVDINKLQSRLGIDFDTDFPYYPVLVKMLEGLEGVESIEPDNTDLYFHWDDTVPTIALLASAKINMRIMDVNDSFIKFVSGLDEYTLDFARAVLESGLAVADDLPALYHFLNEDNLYRFRIINASNEEELGAYWLNESPGAVPEEMTAEEYGRQCVESEEGVFTKRGYIYERVYAKTPEKELAAWNAITDSSRYTWTEDDIFRLNGRGAMYFIGGETGIYMRVSKEGTLDVGTYEGAIPHIGEAIFKSTSNHKFDNYDQAFTHALETGGMKFLVDLFCPQDKNAIVREAWARLEKERGKTELNNQSGYTSVVNAIRKDKAMPKPPRRPKPVEMEKPRRGGEI